MLLRIRAMLKLVDLQACRVYFICLLAIVLWIQTPCTNWILVFFCTIQSLFNLLHPVMICYLVRSMFQILVSYMWIGESSNHDENPTSFVNSSPVGERNSTLKSPLRKVLSPVNTNIKPFDALVTNEPRTPKTPFPVNCMDNRFQNLGTPLEKFTACRSQVKVQLYK